MIPLRAGSPIGFGMTLKLTVPTPLPAGPPVMVTHGAREMAAHAQPASAVTAKLLVPPAFPTFCAGGASEYEQPEACVTVKVCPATVSVPDRAGPDDAGTVNCTRPSPEPVVGVPSVSHGVLLLALHSQPAA